MVVEKHESIEAPKLDYKVEQRLLKVETAVQAMNGLTQEAVKAKEKFYPRYWYCSDLVVRYAKEANSTMQEGSFAKNYAKAMETLTRLNQGLDKLLSLSGGRLPDALVADLGLDAALKSRLKTMELKYIVPSLMEAGLSDPERIGWISLFVMMKESSQKTPDASSTTTLPLERSLNNYVKRTDVDLLVADFDKFSSKL